jgi:predicted O-linked N-acetylglucosamine transferase (SPINDLY family)
MAAFNRLSKITGETVRVWLACLKRISRAVLWIASDDDAAAVNLRALMARAGLAPERLIVVPRAYIMVHARRHGLADVALDPLGFNGGHSTALSLLTGVPVVSLPGRCFAWRMSAALLRQAGLGECVVASPGGYVDQVARLADDPTLAERYRGLLVPRRLAGIFETRRYAAALEAGFLEIARRRGRGAPDRDIDVAALFD